MTSLDDMLMRGHRIPDPSELAYPKPRVEDAGEYLKLSNLSCVDADDNIFEKYDTLYIKKDIESEDDGWPRNFKGSYQGILHCEQQQMFLPSFALTCNIIAVLYENRALPQADAVLKQYSYDKCIVHGPYTLDPLGPLSQNTLVQWDYGEGTIIHYPQDTDFSFYSEGKKVNENKICTHLRFKAKSVSEDDSDSMNLDEALQHEHFNSFIKNLTGLQNPKVLMEVGVSLNKQVYLWLPWKIEEYVKLNMTYFGSDPSYLGIYTNVWLLAEDSYIRGVTQNPLSLE